MKTLSVAYIIRNEREFIKESLLSVKDIADEVIIVLDTRSNDGTYEIAKESLKGWCKESIIETRDWITGTKQKEYNSN